MAVNKIQPASSRFRSVCEEDLDDLLVKGLTTSRFILKQLEYLLSISMRDRNLELFIKLLNISVLRLCELERDLSSCAVLVYMRNR